jgi:hypothetical protein
MYGKCKNAKSQRHPTRQAKPSSSATQFIEIIKQLVDRLTGKDTQFTYDFQNLEIDVPRVTGSQGKELASAKWKINGKFVLSTHF